MTEDGCSTTGLVIFLLSSVERNCDSNFQREFRNTSCDVWYSSENTIHKEAEENEVGFLFCFVFFINNNLGTLLLMNHIHMFATESVMVCCLKASVNLDGMEVLAEVWEEEKRVRAI